MAASFVFFFFFNFCCKLSVYTYIQCSSFVAALNILSFNKIIWKTTKFYVVCQLKLWVFLFLVGGDTVLCLFLISKTQTQLWRVLIIFRPWGVSPGFKVSLPKKWKKKMLESRWILIGDEFDASVFFSICGKQEF